MRRSDLIILLGDGKQRPTAAAAAPNPQPLVNERQPHFPEKYFKVSYPSQTEVLQAPLSLDV